MLAMALATGIPESVQWHQHRDGESWWVEVDSPVTADRRRLEVLLRHDGAVDVSFHSDLIERSPAEAHFPLEDGREAETFQAVAQLVAELVSEHRVLAFRRGWFRGGREFLRPSELTPANLRTLELVLSWRGTYDSRPAR